MYLLLDFLWNSMNCGCSRGNMCLIRRMSRGHQQLTEIIIRQFILRSMTKKHNAQLVQNTSSIQYFLHYGWSTKKTKICTHIKASYLEWNMWNALTKIIRLILDKKDTNFICSYHGYYYH